ncbi:nonstructural protein [Microviridae sp.]|nr:nonstructural protein [Microviridae sp.]
MSNGQTISPKEILDRETLPSTSNLNPQELDQMDSQQVRDTKTNYSEATMKLYAVGDLKAQCFTAPVVRRNDQVAMRDMSFLVNEKENQYAQFPEDYIMVRLGEWNETTGQIELEDQPVTICNLASLVKETD